MTELAIIGGGLAGLALARHAASAGIDWQLFEARDRFGGRIHGARGVDLGPSWFWPGHERMARLAAELGVEVFEQFSDGDALYEDGQQLQRASGFASMAGALRLRGGMSALVSSLVAGLPSERLHLGVPVTRVSRGCLHAGRTIEARQIALAVPPRLVPGLVPNLTPAQVAATQGIPGWMAGQAKVIGLYARPKWREQGLSGDAVSRIGPLVEMHDASDGAQAAIFGFVGVPAAGRDGQAHAMVDAARAQLTRLFGAPEEVIFQDWAQEPFTASRPDWGFNGPHPDYGCPPALRRLWDGQLMLASTELAANHGGFLEGALERAETLFGKMAGDTTPV